MRPTGSDRPRILMCAPDHYGVDYVINPWMAAHVGGINHARALSQWLNLRDLLAPLADLKFVAPHPGLPDMVFTANAGLVSTGKVILSRFHFGERRDEEGFFREWFEAHEFSIAPWPEDVSFEGAGDALADQGEEIIWCGFGFRSSEKAAALVGEIFGRETVALRLVDARFYHLDTCFCPLSGGQLMYFPPAFDDQSRKKIEEIVGPKKRLEVAADDALNFSCNAVEIAGHVFMNAASGDLQNRLRAMGYAPALTPLTEFLKAGGAAKCLTLRL
ncbi:MAG TPA: arginine deiminase-related protein [Methylocystis sp.]|nr:arginine deiminase-related protein [Methylocystis sp.]